MSYPSYTPEPKKRKDAGLLQITERDILTLNWIAEQYCVSFDHLRLLLGRHPKAPTKYPDALSLSATRHAVARWLQLGLIEEPRKVIATHAPYLWLSRKGLTQFDFPYSYYQPKPSMIAHLYAINAIRLYLEQGPFPFVWYSTRSLVRISNYRPVPDAELHVVSSVVAVQVMERKRPLAITLREEMNVLQTLASRGNGGQPYYQHLWYFLSDETLPFFQQALTTLDASIQERVRLYPLEAQEQTRRPLEDLTQQHTQDRAM